MNLRLLITKKCNRACEGCCNKQYDLDALEVENDFSGYDKILITGGEPMLDVPRLLDIVGMIRKQTKAPIYVYTARVSNVRDALEVMYHVDGMTLTLHDQDDVYPFMSFYSTLHVHMNHCGMKAKSLRLNVFAGVDLKGNYPLFDIKRDMVWIKDCPIPNNEVFKRLKVI